MRKREPWLPEHSREYADDPVRKSLSFAAYEQESAERRKNEVALNPRSRWYRNSDGHLCEKPEGAFMTGRNWEFLYRKRYY